MKSLLVLLLGLSLVLPSFCGSTNETTTASGAHLLTRSYKISPDAFVQNLKKLAPPKSGESNQQLLVRFFKENHIEILKPAAVFLDEKKERLLVRTTQTDMDQIESLIQKIMNPK